MPESKAKQAAFCDHIYCNHLFGTEHSDWWCDLYTEDCAYWPKEKQAECPHYTAKERNDARGEN